MAEAYAKHHEKVFTPKHHSANGTQLLALTKIVVASNKIKIFSEEVKLLNS